MIVKRARKSLTRKRLPLGGRATKTVKVKLRGAAPRALRRHGRLRLKLAATLKGPVGKARTTRASVTVILPRRRRSRNKAPVGGGDDGRDGSIPEGSYTGIYTSQMSAAPGSSPISFRVTGGQVVEFRTRVHVGCTGSGIGSAIADFNPQGGATIAPDGSFKTKFHDTSDKENFIYEGKINPNGTASGKLIYQDFPLSGSGFCNGAGPWSARR